MDTMLVMVFDDETQACEGQKALLQLDQAGDIGIYGYVVVTKHADGTTTVKQQDPHGPLATLGRAALGRFVNRLGEPTGLPLEGSATHAAMVDSKNARVGEDFIDDVMKVLLPNRVAIVAEIAEEWTTPVDLRMASIGGNVFRWALSDVKPQD
jgi:uncharacterized membrane protein